MHGIKGRKRVVLNQSKSDSVRFFLQIFLMAVSLSLDVVGRYSLPHSSILSFILETIISHSIERTCSERLVSRSGNHNRSEMIPTKTVDLN